MALLKGGGEAGNFCLKRKGRIAQGGGGGGVHFEMGRL